MTVSFVLSFFIFLFIVFMVLVLLANVVEWPLTNSVCIIVFYFNEHHFLNINSLILLQLL